jgi:hypothetical protein
MNPIKVAKPIKTCSDVRTRQAKADDGTYTARSESCGYSWVGQAYAIKAAGIGTWQAYPEGVPTPE